MNSKIKIIEVTNKNIGEHPNVICFINPKNEFYHKKIEWLEKMFKQGLKIKLLYLDGLKRAVGFVEYVLGKNCWRGVSAKGYMFIHCIWTNGKKFQHQSLGKLLLREVEDDAQDMFGVATITSSGSFMANKNIFIKNGYKIVSESGKEQLLVKSFKKTPLPTFQKKSDVLAQYRGLIMIYSKQCPWVARFINEVKPFLQKLKLTPKIIEINSATQAQNSPSTYSTFNLIYDGKILADRYISTTRFMNIIKKEVKTK